MFTIKNFSNKVTIEDHKDVQPTLLRHFKGQHVSVEYTLPSGLKMNVFVTVENHSPVKTYGRKVIRESHWAGIANALKKKTA